MTLLQPTDEELREFQSTQSSQTVTGDLTWGIRTVQFQSTQSSQTVTGLSIPGCPTIRYFNPHSPRRLWRQIPISSLDHVHDFNPHSPRRLWPLLTGHHLRECLISIHTVLADCDQPEQISMRALLYFNPHSPRRLWRYIPAAKCIKRYFNPHSPRRLWPAMPNRF